MTYEEKRELRLQISQLLADAGLNQKAIKDIVEQEIKNKVERGFDQCLNPLNAQCSSGDYIKDRIENLLLNVYLNRSTFNNAVKEELKNRVIQVVLKNVEMG